MPVVGIRGASGFGKTTLIDGLAQFAFGHGARHEYSHEPQA
jgi:molybdopterin-guanine dinucleotide biosynthesis protein